MKTRLLFLFSFLLIEMNLNALERGEHYVVGKMQISMPSVTIDSESVTFNNRYISSEIILRNTSNISIESEISICITPLGQGVPFTEGLLPDHFSLSINDKPYDYMIKYRNKDYSPEKAEQIKCYEDSFCLFNIKMLPNEQKIINIKYKNDFIPFSEDYFLFYVFSAEKNKSLEVFQNEEAMLIENLYEPDVFDGKSIPQKSKLFSNVKRINNGVDFYYRIDIPESTKVIRCDINVIQFNLMVTQNPKYHNYGYVKFNDINCSEKLLSKADLFYLRKEYLSFLRNCFYACHGYIFKRIDLMEEFSEIYESQGVSYPYNSNFSESDFNDIEKANINLIKEMENIKEPLLLYDSL